MRLFKLAGRWLPAAVDKPPAVVPVAAPRKRPPRRAIRLKQNFPGLPLVAARQLVACGHRTATSVAARSTVGLVADLRRWSLTSIGRRRTERYPLPTADQLDHWLGRPT